MEFPTGVIEVESGQYSQLSFNPSFNGIPNGSFNVGFTLRFKVYVSILLLMEFPTGAVPLDKINKIKKIRSIETVQK